MSYDKIFSGKIFLGGLMLKLPVFSAQNAGHPKDDGNYFLIPTVEILNDFIIFPHYLLSAP